MPRFKLRDIHRLWTAEFLQAAAKVHLSAPTINALATHSGYHTIPCTYTSTMKRKLNSEDVPEVVAPEGGETPAATPAKATFDTLNLDARILQAITREKFTEPTPVQAATLPLALNGKDILGMFGRFERRYVQD
jgi:hypothetical protein